MYKTKILRLILNAISDKNVNIIITLEYNINILLIHLFSL